ncbi:MAG TPA: FmdE family protein [Anaerolineales bacterium]
MRTLDEILRESSSRHKHLCPRQVLGARMALYASQLLDLDLPRVDKRLLVISETDGCTVDGLIAATGCHVGGRTLRILDFGKVAATFTDTASETSLRIVPSPKSRSLARECFPTARNRWEAMLLGYQCMPASELFIVQHVQLDMPLSQIVSRAGRRTMCDVCGEEVINGRETSKDDLIVCRACAGDGYFQILEEPEPILTDGQSG